MSAGLVAVDVADLALVLEEFRRVRRATWREAPISDACCDALGRLVGALPGGGFA